MVRFGSMEAIDHLDYYADSYPDWVWATEGQLDENAGTVGTGESASGKETPTSQDNAGPPIDKTRDSAKGTSNKDVGKTGKVQEVTEQTEQVLVPDIKPFTEQGRIQ